jgi:membrane fusion protein, multidrug efflux system
MRSCVPDPCSNLASKPLYPLVGAVLLLLLAACSKPAAAPEPVPAVRTLTVARSQAEGSREYAAEVRAQVESRLAFRVAGKLVSRTVGLGEGVKPGQVLATLDPQDLQLGQDAARSGALAARAAYDQAAADFARFKELRDQGFISAAELERRESGLKAAKAQFDQANALAGVQANLARYGKLVADVKGVVTAVEADPGAVLAAGAPVLRVAQDGPRDVVFSVPEDQVDALRALRGSHGALTVRLWGADDKPIAATVREVAAAADAATRTFLVKASVGQADVRLGQSAVVSLPQASTASVLTLPLAAVFDHRGKTSVWRLDPTTMTVHAQAIEVAANATDGAQLVVQAGLEPGQRIVSAGVHVLTQGQKVRLYGAPVAALPTAAAASAQP